MRIKAAAVAVLTALSVASVHASDKVKIGFISSLSGPLTSLGVAVRDGFNLAIEQNGGKLGGVAVEMFVADDQNNPDVAKQAAERMIKKEKVDFLTGILGSSLVPAVERLATESKTFYVSVNTGPSWMAGEKCSPYFFASSWVSDSYSEATGKYVAEKGYRKVITVVPNYPGGKDNVNGFKRYFPHALQAELYPKYGELDFASELTQIRAAKPDAVFFFLPGMQGISFLKQWNQAGLSKDIALVGTGWNFDQDTLNAVGDIAVGNRHIAHWNTDFDNAQNKRFVADFEKKYGRLPSVYASQGYDGALLIDAAVRQVKGKVGDRDALRRALQTVQFPAVRGTFKFNKNQFPIQDYYALEVVKDDKGRVVNKTVAKVLTAHQDAYVSQCKMN